ncbi:MAG: DUF1735 and LamG domain-containing protein [Bacteroidales bacterium]|jgi:hypothetical protein|nr:DUF1735 and LamG domain-containing protein [Bacteroidales bacterium]
MKRTYLYLLLLFVFFFSGCREDGNFDNKVFINGSSGVGELLIKGNPSDESRSIQVALAKPSCGDVFVDINVDPSLVSVYNKAYYDNAIMLPDTLYKLDTNRVSIKAGSVKSEEAKVEFFKLSALSRDTVYVLPVTINCNNMDILKSAKNYYYVFRGAALINVVADIEKNYLTIDWKNPDVCNNLDQLTMEALIKVRDYDRLISSVMGIEGRFLIRIGDAGFPSNQIQIATRSGNFPSADSNKGLPVNEWIHIALTYDSSDNHMIIYVNGKVQSEGTMYTGSVNLGEPGKNGFCIGRSYEDSRYLCGDIAECRIWNIVRTKEEIADNPYGVDPESVGLVAYWKFDDQSALRVKDYSGNGNDAVAAKTLSWKSVSLPENN